MDDMLMSDITGIVFDIDHFAAHDGPGIRTCVYLKGCPLRCAWCHSPESQSSSPQLLYAAARCVNCGFCARECPLGLHTFESGPRSHIFSDSVRDKCAHCGRCAGVCPSGSLRMSGKLMNASDVAREALDDIAFFKNSGGGVTLSGGEALYQAAFARAILKIVKEAGVHTIVETSGFGKESDLLSLVPYTDCFYYDFKLADKNLYERYIGKGAELVQNNLKKLSEHMSAGGIVLRVPLIPGITGTPGNLSAAVDLAAQLRITEIQLLPYNVAAAAKYEWVGRKYSLAPTDSPALPDLGWLRKYAGSNITISMAKI